MPTFDPSFFALLGLVLAFLMTLVALASYRSYEIARRRLLDRELELHSIQSGAKEFRQKAADAFVDQKSLRVRIDTLERSLGLANEQLYKEREESARLRAELNQLQSEYEATKVNLTEAFKRLREQS
jgi:septal ring factor EnvC (AmiA/AmiB activator)